MPRKKSDAVLLDLAENIEDFILLLASGASPNCELKGEQLVKKYYGELVRTMQNRPITDSNNSKKLMLDKLKTLLSARADVTTIFQTSFPNYYSDPIFSLSLVMLENQQTLLEILLENEQARQWMAQEPFYHETLERITQQMERVTASLKLLL